MKKLLDVKSMPLSAKVLVIAIGFWAVPLLVIGGYSIFFYSDSINSRIDDYLENQFANYNEVAAEKINSVIDSSKNATYDMVIEDAYIDYSRGKISHDSFYNEVDGYLREKYYLNKRYMMSAFFLSADADELNINSRIGESCSDYYRQRVHSRAALLSRSLGTDIGFITAGNNIYMIRNMMLVRGPYNIFGVIVLEIDPDYLFGHMSGLSDPPEGIVISLNDSVFILKAAPRQEGALKGYGYDIAGALLGTDRSHIEDRRGSVVFYNRRNTDSYALGSAVVMDKGMIYSRYRNLIGIIYLIVILFIPCIIYMLFFLYRNVSVPIRKLVDATGNIRNGNFGVHLDEEGMRNYEFKAVAGSFNSMSSELKRLFNYVYKEELVLKDAKILALQSQINPHFLGNTLEMMNWQARIAGDTEVSGMIEALSVLMDAGMGRSDSSMIPLSEEISCVDAYLYIISKRFGKRVTIEKQIDPALLRHTVPKLILQPIVENAVVHGIEPVQCGTVTIKVYPENGDMVMDVINDGKEIEDEELRMIAALLSERNEGMNSAHLGIRNVNERLKLIYGERYGISLGRDDGGRTKAEIRIPLEYSK